MFKIDAVSMYSNIDTDHGMEIMRRKNQMALKLELLIFFDLPCSFTLLMQ